MVELYQIDDYELMQKELKAKDKKIKKLEEQVEQMDIEIGDKGDQIASFMTDKLKQNQFEVVAEGNVDVLCSKIDVRIGNEFIVKKFFDYQGKNIQLIIKVLSD